MAYVTISVIAPTYRRAQLHFGNYLESALKRRSLYASYARTLLVWTYMLAIASTYTHVRFSVGIMQKFGK